MEKFQIELFSPHVAFPKKMLNFSLQTFLNLNNFIKASIPHGKYRIPNEFLSYK